MMNRKILNEKIKKKEKQNTRKRKSSCLVHSEFLLNENEFPKKLKI